MKTLSLDRILLRNDSKIAWEKENPILAQGELGLENDTHLLKVGDGKTAWNELNYASKIPLSNQVDVITLDEGQDASAEIVGDGSEESPYRFIISIPRGYTGVQGPQGIQGIKGDKGEQGIKGEKGDTGERGPQGKPFAIAKTYASVEEMELSHAIDGLEIGAIVAIASEVNQEDNAKLYVKTAEGYAFLVDMSGARGIQGERGPKGDPGLTFRLEGSTLYITS